jgi:hypothetical protein
VIEKFQYFPPASGAPLFWMNEETSLMKRIMFRFDDNPDLLYEREVEILRQYFEQWINAPVWKGDLAELTESVKTLKTGNDCKEWVLRAMELGIDPL